MDGKSHYPLYTPLRGPNLLDPQFGAFYWTGRDGETPAEDNQGKRVWDTQAFWDIEAVP